MAVGTVGSLDMGGASMQIALEVPPNVSHTGNAHFYVPHPLAMPTSVYIPHPLATPTSVYHTHPPLHQQHRHTCLVGK